MLNCAYAVDSVHNDGLAAALAVPNHGDLMLGGRKAKGCECRVDDQAQRDARRVGEAPGTPQTWALGNSHEPLH
ncbi:hypothetical protein GCM10023317_61560 [Actinopolymorpha pittospori]